MKHIKSGIQIAIVFTMAIFVFVACEKDLSGPSFDAFDEVPKLGTLMEVPVFMYTSGGDSLRTSAQSFQYMGAVQDAPFGSMKANFYVQYELAQTSVDFGATATVDSVFWELPFERLYGNAQANFRLNIYEAGTAVSRSSGAFDSVVYSNGSMPAGDLISTVDFVPTPVILPAMGNVPTQPGFRIPLDKDFFQARIIDAAADPATASNFSDNNNFVKYFKGLYLEPDSNNQAILQVKVWETNNRAQSRIRIFYSVNDTVQREFSLLHNNSNAVFNFYNHNYSNAAFDLNNQDTTFGEQNTYVQSMAGVFTEIDLRGVKALKDSGFAINFAELIVPVLQGNFLQAFDPLPSLSVLARDPSADNIPRVILDGGESGQFGVGGNLSRPDPRRFVYRFKITRHLNAIIQNDQLSEKILLTGRGADGYRRIILNGNQFVNDPPVLNIYYTKPVN